MLRTYYKSIATYLDDIQVHYLGQIDILEESEAVDFEITYTGYNAIEKHISDIPCMIYHDTNRRTKKQFLIVHKEDSCKNYNVYEGSEATIKVCINYRETNPRFEQMLNIKADKVFQYMAQFLPTKT